MQGLRVCFYALPEQQYQVYHESIEALVRTYSLHIDDTFLLQDHNHKFGEQDAL